MTLVTGGLGRPGGSLVIGGLGRGLVATVSSLGFMSGAQWAATAAAGAADVLVSMLPTDLATVPLAYDAPVAYDAAGVYDRTGSTATAATITASPVPVAVMSLQVAAATTILPASGDLTAVTYDSPLAYDAPTVYDRIGTTATAALAAGVTVPTAAAAGSVTAGAVAADAARSTVPWTYDTNSGYDPSAAFDATGGAVPVAADATGRDLVATMMEAA